MTEEKNWFDKTVGEVAEEDPVEALAVVAAIGG